MSAKRQLMAEQWDDFARRVLPISTSPTQRREMRRAFYAGAEAILMRVIESFAPENEPTPEDVQLMENVYQELTTFAAEVKAGRA
jgi:hypothetical protein